VQSIVRLKFSLLIFLSLNSCSGFCRIESGFEIEAKRLYEMIGTYRANIDNEQAKKIFGNCYRSTDKIFISQNIFKKKYILVRYGEPITYEDEDVWRGF
jgi:hypothetical protein